MYPTYSKARDFEHMVMSNYLQLSKMGMPGNIVEIKSKSPIQLFDQNNTNGNTRNGVSTDETVQKPNWKQNSSENSMKQRIEDKISFCGNRKWWWEPPKDSVTKDFCLESSMHGLRYLTQPKLHILERVFWLIAFFIGVAAAGILINDVWQRYHRIPVIVSFLPVEMDIEFIPFPAFTICNMNPIPKNEVDDILSKVAMSSDDQDYDETESTTAKLDLKFLQNLCAFQQSFANNFGFAAMRGKVDSLDTGPIESLGTTLDEDGEGIDQPVEHLFLDFIKRRTVPCNELIRLCIWAGKPEQNCSLYFKPILTEYGNCCTFNMIPQELLYTNAHYSKNASKAEEGTKSWSEADIESWKRWNYSNDGFIITDTEKITFPRRQVTPGLPYGLSLLLDANTEDYFCPSSDSEGFRFALHSAVEAPHIIDNGMSVGLDQEIFMEVNVDLTMADAEVDDFEFEKRQCYFGHERKLQFYNPYTTSNCIEECITKYIIDACNCSFFYMPRGEQTRFCTTLRNGPDFKCVAETKKKTVTALKQMCPTCDSLCMDASYRFESTSSTLQSSSQLWAPELDTTRTNLTEPPSWAGHKMSIIHIFFATGSTTPKVRKALYGATDLIANTGGILGLCLGFSVLSAVEVLYFFTCRLCFQKIRRKTVGKQIANKFMNALLKHKKVNGTERQPPSNNRVITLKKEDLRIFPAYHTHIE